MNLKINVENKECMIMDLLLEDFKNKKDRTAIITRNRQITYDALLDNIYKTVEFLISNGVEKKDRVFLFLENSIEFSETFMALNLCKSVIIPIYTKLGIDKLQAIVDFYRPTYIITNEANIDTIFNAKINLPHTDKIFLCKGNEEMTVVNIAGIKVKDTDLDDDVAVILSSSGTTTAPKGIMLTNINIVSNTTEIARYMGVSKNDSILMIKNINHSSSITGELLVGLFSGCTIHIYNGIIHAKVILDYLKEHAISVFFAVPSIMACIIRNGVVNYHDLSKLRIIHFSGAIAQKKDIESMIKCFPNSELINAYGLTEASPRVSYATKEKLVNKSGTTGYAINGVKIQIKDNDRILDVYEKGEIVVTGPNIMKGYYRNIELTKKVLINDELHTGDLGYIDESGDLFVLGRKDNMIIKNGRNIYPEEIEKVISMIEGVVEVMVAEKNEMIVAYVVCTVEKTNMKKMINFCRQRLEDYKVPDKIIYVPELKKNPNHKVLRNVDYL